MAFRRKRGASGNFGASSISGCVLWLSASRIVGLSDGAAVSTWSDLSGQGNDATQTTATNQPTYRLNAINGRPVVRTDGVDNFLNVNGITGALGGNDNPHTVAIAGKILAVADSKDILGGLGTGDNLYVFALNDPGGGVGYQSNRRDAASVSANVNGGTANTSTHIFVLIFYGTTISLFVDNVAVINATASDVGAITLTSARIGSRDGIGTFINMDYAELAVYNRAITDTERQRIQNAWAARYGVTLS